MAVKRIKDEWKIPILASYALLDKTLLDDLSKFAGRYRLYLDSGAFTAFKQGKEIDFDEYCAFVKSPPVPIERYFMLDKIGDPTATKRNLERMLQKGLQPVPVFTRGEDPKELDGFYSVSDLVALGGIAGGAANVGGGQKEYLRWLEPFLLERVVHWLGYADTDFIRYYRPYSVDTTNWKYGWRYGHASVFNLGKVKYYYRHEILLNKDNVQKAITALGLPWWKAKDKGEWRHLKTPTFLTTLCARSAIKLARRMSDIGVSYHLQVMSNALPFLIHESEAL